MGRSPWTRSGGPVTEATSATDSGFDVNDRDHAVQVATRARRSGADDEVVVAALFHDSAKAIDAYRHGEIIATMLAPHVRPDVVWMLRQHQDCTATEIDNGHNPLRRLAHRVLHRGERHDLAVRFVDEWDLPGRDPEYPSDPVESFLPEIDRVLAQRREVRPPFATWVARRVLRKVWHLSGVAQRRVRARVAA